MFKIKAARHLIISCLTPLVGLTACSTMPGQSGSVTQSRPAIQTTAKDGAPPFPVDVNHLKNAKPHYEPKCAYGNPPSYTALGKRYYVMDSAKGYSKVGVASWYGTKFHGRLTSSHEPYDMLAMTAASPTLPIPTYVKVTNLENGRKIIVKVNDRGPFANDRIMDLSYAAAKKLGYVDKGTAKVKVEAITFDPPITTRTLLAKKKSEDHSKKLYVQVGAFQKMAKAEQVKTKVALLTHQPARIEPVKLNDKTLYRVQLGPLADQKKSELVERLHQQGFSNTITVFS